MSLRRLLSGFAAMASATFFAQVSGFVVLVVLARRLSPGDIGAYAFALSLIGYFAIPANFGVTVLGTRDLAQHPQDARAIMGEVTLLQAFVGVVPYVALVALAPVLAVDGASRAILPIVGINFLFEGLALMWVLYGSSRFAVIAIARAVGSAVFAAGCLLFVHEGRDAVTVLAWVTVAGVVATGVITAAVALREQGLPDVRGGVGRLTRRFRFSAPLGIAAVMISIYYTLDSVMLGYIKTTDVVGVYAIAYKLPLAVIGVGALWASVLFPHASALAQTDRRAVREQLELFASLSFVGSLPVLAGSLLVADDLLPRLFGPAYASGSAPFAILMATAALVFVTINYGTTALALGLERANAIAVTLGAVVNLALNFVLIPPFGMKGAAFATLAAEVTVIGYVFVVLRRELGHLALQWDRLARGLLATAVMVAVLLPIGDLTVLVRVVVGSVVFGVAALLLRVISREELRLVLSRPPAEGAA